MGKTLGYAIHWEYQSYRGVEHFRSAALSVCPANGGNPKPAEDQSSHPGWLQQSRLASDNGTVARHPGSFGAVHSFGFDGSIHHRVSGMGTVASEL
jgi:hypothetical protein